MNLLALLILCAVAICLALALASRKLPHKTAFNIEPVVHSRTSLSILVIEATTDENALVTFVDATHVDMTDHVNDIPLGVVLLDSVDTSEIDTIPKNVALLGQHPGTLPVVASAAIALNAEVVPDPSSPGRVKTLPSATGTYQVIGRAAKAAGAAGDTIELLHHQPIARAVA